MQATLIAVSIPDKSHTGSRSNVGISQSLLRLLQELDPKIKLVWSTEIRSGRIHSNLLARILAIIFLSTSSRVIGLYEKQSSGGLPSSE